MSNFFSACVLVCVLACGAWVSAQGVVDQSFLAGPGGGSGLEVTSNQWVAQTFTVGITGQLASVAVEIKEHRCPGTNSLTIKVVTTDASGVPEVLSPALAEVLIPPGTVSPVGGSYALFVIDVLPFGIQVTVGDVLGILLETAAPSSMCTYAWGAAIGGYAAGSSYLIFSPPAAATVHVRDMGFETTVLSGPNCAITSPAPATMVTGDVDILFDAGHPSLAPVSASFDFSTDAGATWFAATAAAGSPLSNPAPALATPIVGADFRWASGLDAVGVAAIAPALFRVTVDDGSATNTCVLDLVVDNTMICTGLCGDCDLNTLGPDILDALAAARIAAGLFIPTTIQEACCDVNTSGVVEVLDALLIAQVAVGLPITLVCV